MEDKLKRHEELCKQIHETFVTKNNDYGDSVHDLLEKLGPITLATRLGDKYNRICSLLTKGLDKQLVKSESILDTFLDLANYAIIGYIEMEQYLNNFSQYPIDEEEPKIKLVPKKDGLIRRKYDANESSTETITIPFSYFVKSFIDIFIGSDITNEKLFNEYVDEINERFYNNLDKCNLNNETDKCTTLDSLLSVLISCISEYDNKVEDISSSTYIYNFANFINPLQITKQIFEQRFIYDPELVIYNTKEKHIKFNKAIK